MYTATIENVFKSELIKNLPLGTFFMKAEEAFETISDETYYLYMVTNIKSKLKNCITCVSLIDGEVEELPDLQRVIPVTIHIDITLN